MKYLKLFEAQKRLPEVGDYVLLNPTKFPWNDKFKEFKKFIATTICQIVRIERVQSHSGENFLGYKVYFEDDIPYGFRGCFDDDYKSNDKKRKYLLVFNDKNYTDQIKYFSKNKEELELKIMAKKYNL